MPIDRPGTAAETSSIPKWRRIAALIVGNAILLVVLLLVLEVGARAYAVAFRGKTFFRPSVDSPWISAYEQPYPKIGGDGHGVFQHDDRSISPTKDSHEYRIVAVGGSTTVGRDAFLAAGYDYPSRLEERLNAEESSGRRYVVLNAGGDGYSTLHSLVNIQTRILAFDPDLIILMEGINDYSVAYFGDTVRSDFGNKYLLPYFVHTQYQVTSSLFGFLSQSRLLSLVNFPHKVTRPVGFYDRSRSVDAVIPHYVRHLASIDAILDRHGVDLLVLSQPHQRSEGEKDARDAALLAGAARDYSTANGVRFVDLFEEFGQNPRYFTDLVHHTPAGVDHLVDLILQSVRATNTK